MESLADQKRKLEALLKSADSNSCSNLYCPVLTPDDLQIAQQNLAQINILLSLTSSRNAIVAYGGQVESTGTLFNQIGSAIGGFVSWLGGALKGLGETLVKFATDPIGSLQSAWNWAVNNPHQAIDLMIGIAVVGVIVASLILTGGLSAGFLVPAMIALDIATIANIFAKTAISGQPLDAWDMVTIGLVGLGNAGAMMRGVKTFIKDSRLLKLADDVGKNIEKVGANTLAKGRIENSLTKTGIKDSTELSKITKLPAKEHFEKYLAKKIGSGNAKVISQTLDEVEMQTLIGWERRGMLVNFDFAGVAANKQSSLVRQAFDMLQSSEFEDAVRVFERRGVKLPENMVWKFKDPNGASGAFNFADNELMATLRKPLDGSRQYSSAELYDTFLHELGHKASVSDKVLIDGKKFNSVADATKGYWDTLSNNILKKQVGMKMEDLWDPFMNTVKNKLLMTNSMVNRQKWLRGWEKQFEDMGLMKLVNKGSALTTKEIEFISDFPHNIGYLAEMKVMYKNLGDTKMASSIDFIVNQLKPGTLNDFLSVEEIFSNGFNSVRWVN